MWKYLIAGLLFLGGLVYAGYYLYMYDKKIANVEYPNTPTPDINNLEKKESPKIPVHLTEEFWKTATPQELENQLKNITNVNEQRSSDKKSMLHLLVQHGNYPEMVKILIDAGIDYNLRDTAEEDPFKTGTIDKKKALFYSVFRREQAYEFIKALIEYDDVNSYVNNNATLLMIVTYNRKPIDMIQMLLEKGADPNKKDLSAEANSLITASVLNRFTGESYIDPKVIQLLLDYNADITAKDAYGKSALDYMKENEEFTKTEFFKKLSTQ